MSCPLNNFAKSLQFLKYGIGGGGPGERLRLRVVALHEFLDAIDEVGDAAEGASSNGLLRDDIEPDFNLIEPGTAGGGVVNVIAGARRQPSADSFVLVRSVVVGNEMYV